MEETNRDRTLLLHGGGAVDDLVAGVFGQAAALDVGTLARRLSMNVETLRRHVRRGRLIGVVVAGRWRVGRTALASFLAGQTAPRRPATAWSPATARRPAVAVLDYEQEPPPPAEGYDDAPGASEPFPF